ncbi:MAG: hypothetical protein AAGI23_12445 [Bacteroidota bacterium]
MKSLLYFLCFLPFVSFSQNEFPKDWTGKWAGDLHIYSTDSLMQTVPMELHILSTDSAHIYDWALIYKASDRAEDKRDYKLIVTDSSYVTDEQNSILLDGYLFDNVFIERFSVMNTLLTVMLEKQGDELHYRIIAGKQEAIRDSGGAVMEEQEIPMVYSYKLGSYHIAVLTRQE